MEKLKPEESEALDIIESLLDVADLKCTGPLYADDPPCSGMCRIPEEDAAKLRQYIADRRAAPENHAVAIEQDTPVTIIPEKAENKPQRCIHYSDDGGCNADNCHFQTDGGGCEIAGLQGRIPENKPITYSIEFSRDEITEFRHYLNAVKNRQTLDNDIRMAVFKLLHKFSDTAYAHKPEGSEPA